MSRTVFLVILCLLSYPEAQAQTQNPVPKYEIALEFTTLQREEFYEKRTEIGVGPRFTLNLNKNVALESAVYFFPDNCFQCSQMGRMTQVVGGVKVGKRYDKWGFFAKARPGFVTFSRGRLDTAQLGQGLLSPTFFTEVSRLTSFTADLGGVLEFYPSKRIVTRFDAGDTLIHFTRQQQHLLAFNPQTQQIIVVPFTIPARTTNNFQFVASVGFRF